MPDSPNNTNPVDTNSLPEYIAHYRILRRLGKGGMGEVLLGEDTKQHGRKGAGQIERLKERHDNLLNQHRRKNRGADGRRPDVAGDFAS